MTCLSMARSTRSGTGLGPGICRKWCPWCWDTKYLAELPGWDGSAGWPKSNNCIHSYTLQYVFEFQVQPRLESPNEISVTAMSDAAKSRMQTLPPSPESDSVQSTENTKSTVVSLHGEVLSRLRDFIVEGNLTDGARIPERQLCEMFGIFP